MLEKNIGVSHKHSIRLCVLAVLAILMFEGTTLAEINMDETKTIGMDMYYELSFTGIQAGDVLNVNVQVTKGGPVDVLLMKSSDYVDYLKAAQSENGGTFKYYIDGSSDNIKSKTYSFSFPESGDYYLVVDNTNNPTSGANPTGDVDVRARITVVPPVEETPGFDAILGIFSIVLLVVITRKG
jgi:hypothetical protein